MEDQFISFETAKLAKEKGFKASTSSYYSPDGELHLNFKESHGEEEYLLDPEDFKENWNLNGLTVSRVEVCSAPTQTILQTWLRKKHQIRVEVYTSPITGKFAVQIMIKTEVNSEKHQNGILWERIEFLGKSGFEYEEALENGLIEGLKLL